ncbi:hypothetical protein BN14_10302 [Rhizoctonia solani AG-1 IB]|uniref:Uncharacterized protein n=1 Tax=Thanatephorus cucumeris (strain AG1-IB / isolate 7/3/14) TaxID=1108050 RepID=M5CA46_THACB|nr:hypothetical protein BN14_10302 [Rhizoctonia solani AG-1 IB]
MELPTAAWIVTIKSLTPVVAEYLFPEEIKIFNAIHGSYSDLEPNATLKYLFKNVLTFANIVAEARPESTAKISFLIYMNAWKLLDQQAQLDDSIRAILHGLTRIRDLTEIAGQASTETLANSIEQAKEPIKGILALLEDISVYIIDRYTTNSLAHIPAEDTEPNSEHDVEVYLSSLEELQKAFFASWSPTVSGTNDLAHMDDEQLDGSQHNNQGLIDEPTRFIGPWIPAAMTHIGPAWMGLVKSFSARS